MCPIESLEPTRITGAHSHPYIGSMSRRKKCHMSRGYVKWNMQLFHSICYVCQLLDVSVELLLHSTGDLPLWLVRKGTLSTAKLWSGFAASWVLLCYESRSCQSEGQSHQDTMQYRRPVRDQLTSNSWKVIFTNLLLLLIVTVPCIFIHCD